MTKFHKKEVRNCIYRVTKAGPGYHVSCIPYFLTEDQQMYFAGGSSYFVVLDEEFNIKSIKPGA